MEPSSVITPSSSLNFGTNRLNGGAISDALRIAPSGGGSGSTKYSRLASEPDSPVRSSGILIDKPSNSGKLQGQEKV